MFSEGSNKMVGSIRARFANITCVLCSLAVVSACGGGGGSGASPRPPSPPPPPPANVAPIADAGTVQSVNEATMVTLSGSGTDTDGSIASYFWTQVSGTAISLQHANSADASFLAPNLPANETLLFQLVVTDDDGATGTATVSVDVADSAMMVISRVSPSFGLPDDSITLRMMGADANTTISFNGLPVIPATIANDSAVFTFTVPAGATTGPVKTISGAKTSNSVMFYVGETGIVQPAPGKVVTDALGNRVAIDYIMVSLFEADDSRAEADRLAGIVSGAVVGRIDMTNSWQISVDVSSLAELEALETTLDMEATVDYALIDTEVLSDDVDWSNDPDHAAQRSRNRVEEAAVLYAASVSPSDINKNPPVFMVIGVSEAGVDFRIDDDRAALADTALTSSVSSRRNSATGEMPGRSGH